MKHWRWLVVVTGLIAFGDPVAAAGDPAVASPAEPAAKEAEKQVDSIKPEDIAEFPDSKLAEAVSFRHPPSRESIRSRAELQVPNLFEDAGREIGISDAKHERLVKLLIDHHVDWIRPTIVDDPDFDFDQAQLKSFLEKMDARQKRELKRLLGASGVKALNRYRKSLDPRYEVEDLRELFEYSPTPLTESQRRRMVLALLQPGAYLYRREYSDSEDVEALRKEVRARVEQNDRQLLATSRDILTAEQWTEYSAYLAKRREDQVWLETPRFAREKVQ